MNQDEPSTHPDQGGDGEQVATKRLVALRVIAFLPLAIGVLAYAVVPGFRAEMNDGVRLLWEQDRDGLREWGSRLGPLAAVATSILMVVQAIAAPIPAVLITWTNSLLYGWFLGGLLSITSATFAAWVCFMIAQTFGEPVVRRLISKSSIEKANRFIDEHGATAILVARLVPFVPFDPISYLAGLSKMRTWTFLWATFIGQIPAGFAYSYLIHIENPQQLSWQLPLLLTGLVLFGWGSRYLLLRRR